MLGFSVNVACFADALRVEIRIDREKQIRLDRNQERDRIRERDGNVNSRCVK